MQNVYLTASVRTLIGRFGLPHTESGKATDCLSQTFWARPFGSAKLHQEANLAGGAGIGQQRSDSNC